jgi:hypothetical protein
VLDAPRDEAQHAGGGAIEPVRVLGDDQQRRALGGVGEQLEHGERDQEAVGRCRLGHAEGGQKCRLLRAGQPVGMIEHRQHELVQPRKRQLRLGLHPGRAQHLHPRRLGPPTRCHQ